MCENQLLSQVDFMKRPTLEHKVERDLAKRAAKLQKEKEQSDKSGGNLKAPLLDQSEVTYHNNL